MNQRDRELLQSWCKMENPNVYLERAGAFSQDMPDDAFFQWLKEYDELVKKRIGYCIKLLDNDKDELIYYTLAYLHNLRDPDEVLEVFSKYYVRLYCLKAIRLDRSHSASWALLAYTYSWRALFGGIKGDAIENICVLAGNVTEDKKAPAKGNPGTMSEDQRKKIRLIEKAISCIKKAIKIEPLNGFYQSQLRNYYFQRNEEYKPEHLPRRII